MANIESTILLKLTADFDQPITSFQQLDARVKAARKALAEVPFEGTQAFEKLTKEISQNLNISIEEATALVKKFQADTTKQVQVGTAALKQYRETLKTIEPASNSLNEMRQRVKTLEREISNLDITTQEFADKQAELLKVRNELKELEKATGDARRSVGGYEEAIKKALDEFRPLAEIRAELAQLNKGQQDLIAKANLLANAIRKDGAELDALAAKYRRAGDEGKSSQDILQRELLETNEDLKKNSQQIEANTRDLQKAGSVAGTLAQQFGGLAAALGIGFGIGAIKNTVTGAINIFREFNQQIATLGAVSGASSIELAQLEEDAKRIGETTQFTATQIAAMQTSLARLGFSPKEILESTEAIANLSIATGEDIEASATIIGQSIRAYGLEASDATRLTDILAKAFNASALGLSTFGEASKLLAPTAKVLGISIEESTAAIALLADNGLEGTIATQTLGSALSRLADDSKKQSEAAKKLGIEVFNANGEFVGLAQLLQNVTTATKGFTDQQRLAALSQIVGVDAAKNFSILLESEKKVITETGEETLKGGEALQKFTQELELAAGEAKATADIMSNTLNGDLLELESAIEGVALRFASTREGGLREFIQFLTNSIPVLQEYSSILVKLATILALYIARQKLAGAITILTSTAQKALAITTQLLTVANGGLAVSIRAFGAAFKASGIGTVITLVAALILGIVELYQRNETLRNGVASLTKGIKDFFTNTDTGRAIVEGLSRVWAGLVMGFKSGITILAGIATGVFNFVKETGLLQAVLGSLQKRISNAYNNFVFLKDIIVSIGSSIANFVRSSEFLSGAFDAIASAVQRGLELFYEVGNTISNLPALFAGVSAATTQAGRNISVFFQKAYLDAQIFSEQLAKLNPFGRTVEQIDANIAALKKQRSDLSNSQTGVLEAFSGAYADVVEQQKLSADLLAQTTKATKEATKENQKAVGALGGLDKSGGVAGGSEEDDDKKKKKELNFLEQKQARQKELASEIENLIAKGEPYIKQLTEFTALTAELTGIEKKYKEAIGEVDKTTKVYAEGSLGFYSSQLSKLKEELEGLVVGSEGYITKQQEITAAELMQGRALELLKVGTQEYQQAQTELKTQLTDQTAENEAYQNAANRLKGITSATEEGAKEIEAIEKELSTNLRQIQINRLQESNAILATRLANLDAQEQKELQLYGTTEAQKLAIEQDFERQRNELRLQQLVNQKELLDAEFANVKESEAEKTVAITEAEKQREEIRQAAFQVAQALSDATFQRISENQERQLEETLARIDAEEARAIKAAESQGASEAALSGLRASFAKRREEEEIKAAKKRKALALAQAIINTALAVTSALTAPPPISYVLAGLVAALGAIEIGVIATQKFGLGDIFDMDVRGGKFAKGAYLKDGAYHSQGGMPIINPHTGRKVAEIEKGEGIINKRTMGSGDILELSGTPYDIASQLNNYKGYGVSFPGAKRSFNRGGYTKLSSPTSAVSFKNGGHYGVQPRILKYKTGGIGTEFTQQTQAQDANQEQTQTLLKMAINEIIRLQNINRAGFSSIPSTAEELRQVSQMQQDEANAT